MKTVTQFTVLLGIAAAALACGNDPLRPLPTRAEEIFNEPIDEPIDEPVDEPIDEPVDEPIDEPNEPVDNGDNTPEGVACVDGSDGSSWRDALPDLPQAVLAPDQLAIDGVGPRASCVGDEVLRNDGQSWGDLASRQLHIGGQWYGEATIQVFGDGGTPTIGVFAYPASLSSLIFGALFSTGDSSVASTRPNAVGIISIAADLDAGVITFYGNGVRSEVATVSLIPGVGGYALAANAAPGNVIELNLGSEPFTYAPPPGFAAWSSDSNGGPCDSAAAVPAPAAAVTADDNTNQGYVVTSFLASVPNDIELVVLGAYDTGGTSGWEWGPNGEQIDTGNFSRGSVRVQVRRPGRIALVLSAYEPTDWSIEVGPNTQLETVMVRGMHPPSVTGVPTGVPVDVSSICTDGNGGDCGAQTGDNFPIAPYQWPFDFGGGDTQGFIDYVEAELCLPLTIFGGTYTTRSFTVN